MKKVIKLKNLEGGIMGSIVMRKHCTAYRVHKDFVQSPSQYFSGSAGAVYPAFKRLEKRGLIKAKSVGTKLRPAKGFALTKKGLEAYKAWYLDPIQAVDAGFDPLRFRFSLLPSLAENERPEFVQGMEKALTQRLTGLDEMMARWPEKSGMYMAGEVERAALEAKLKVVSKWRKSKIDLANLESI
ncbi:MAG: PadR family transcriptional regulator [Sphingomonadales bacterium]